MGETSCYTGYCSLWLSSPQHVTGSSLSVMDARQDAQHQGAGYVQLIVHPCARYARFSCAVSSDLSYRTVADRSGT